MPNDQGAGPQFVTRFTMGQDVPEWLLVAEPEQPGAPRGHFRFCVDVDVIDTPNYYIILPNLALHNGGPVIDNNGMMGHRIMAAGKPVAMPLAGSMWFDSSTSPQFRELEAQRREAAERLHLAQTVRQQDPLPAPDSHPTFWSRLLYVFRGR